MPPVTGKGCNKSTAPTRKDLPMHDQTGGNYWLADAIVWLENDGRQGFTPWQIADRPTHLATVACGDLDGDGRADVVAGSFHVLEPFDRLGRITLWLSGSEKQP